MQILPNSMCVGAPGLSLIIMSDEGLLGRIIALALHTGVLSKTFCNEEMQKSCATNFPGLTREALGLHIGVLTKTFAMSVLN